MKWYIGQEIVAINDHSQGKFKKGDVFTIKGLRSAICKCSFVEINIGINEFGTSLYCPTCCMECEDKDITWWFNEVCFAPLDFDISELTSILETPLELAHEQRKEKGQ